MTSCISVSENLNIKSENIDDIPDEECMVVSMNPQDFVIGSQQNDDLSLVRITDIESLSTEAGSSSPQEVCI